MNRPGDVSQLDNRRSIWLSRHGRRSSLSECNDNCDLVFFTGASTSSQ